MTGPALVQEIQDAIYIDASDIEERVPRILIQCASGLFVSVLRFETLNV